MPVSRRKRQLFAKIPDWRLQKAASYSIIDSCRSCGKSGKTIDNSFQHLMDRVHGGDDAAAAVFNRSARNAGTSAVK